MGRPRDPNARRNNISTRFSDPDVTDMDKRRGHLSIPDYLRWLVRKARELDLHVKPGDRP